MQPLLFLGDKRPFLPSREPRPTPAAQAAVDHDLGDDLRREINRLAQSGIPAGGDVVIIPIRLALGGIGVDAFEQYGF
jgi:hypothetical protein